MLKLLQDALRVRSVPAHRSASGQPGEMLFPRLPRFGQSAQCANYGVIANAIGTPFHALTKRAKLQPGERIVITGAGGGVGAIGWIFARLGAAKRCRNSRTVQVLPVPANAAFLIVVAQLMRPAIFKQIELLPFLKPTMEVLPEPNSAGIAFH